MPIVSEGPRNKYPGDLARYLATGETKIIGRGREVVGRRKDGHTFPMRLAVGEYSFCHKRMFTGLR